MSQENVELVKQALDAFNRRDIDAFLELVTDDYEWFPSMVTVFEGGSFRGREGVETYFLDSANTWQELRVVGHDFRDLGERIVVLGRTEGHGRVSGTPSGTEIGMVVDIRGGKLSCVRAYLDYGHTLRAAGIEE